MYGSLVGLVGRVGENARGNLRLERGKRPLPLTFYSPYIVR